MDTGKSLASLVIPTRNEEKNIERCLESILRQTYSPIEIIIVDKNSRDKTVEIAKKYTDNIFFKEPERSTQRNYGAQKARGEFVTFIDADMQLEPAIISECVDQFSQKNVKAVILSEKVVGSTFWGKVRSLEKQCYMGDDLIEAARCFVKELFLKLGGFDTKLIASEDWDLTESVRKARLTIGRTQSFVAHYEKEANPFEAAQKKYYYGLNLPLYIRKHKTLALRQYSPLRLAFLRNWRLLLAHPLLTLGLIMMKLFEFAGGGLG